MKLTIHINADGDLESIKADVLKVFSALECFAEIPPTGLKLVSNHVACNVQKSQNQ